MNWTKLTLWGGVLDARFESALLLFLSNFHPVLDENDPGVDHIFLRNRAKFEEFFVLFRGAKTHDIFHARAVVPAPVENDDFSGRREMRHISLDVHLRFFAIRWGRQRDQTEDSWAYP